MKLDYIIDAPDKCSGVPQGGEDAGRGNILDKARWPKYLLSHSRNLLYTRHTSHLLAIELPTSHLHICNHGGTQEHIRTMQEGGESR